jgi:hypothetical protein
MNRRRLLVGAGVFLLAVLVAAVVRDQVRAHKSHQAREIEAPIEAQKIRLRHSLLEMLQPVALTNCRLERFGEAHDGGYLMCGNLLGGVQSGYSYGIGGYDKWGCDISTRLKVKLHQYDCFNTTRPACPGGDTVFHAECVGGTVKTEEGRFFDTIKNQFAKNGDGAKRIVMKIDVEGAEWDSFREAPDEVLNRIDQIAVEFHWLQDEKHRWLHDEKYMAVVQRLKTFFHIAHLHFNNAGCTPGLDPFLTWAYEVLFVSKRLAAVDPSRSAAGLHHLDAPNNPSVPDCQSTTLR